MMIMKQYIKKWIMKKRINNKWNEKSEINNKIINTTNKWMMNNNTDNETTSKLTSEFHSGLGLTPKMEFSSGSVDGELATISTKNSFPNVWLCSESVSGLYISYK